MNVKERPKIVNTVFSDCQCVFRASNASELRNQVNKILSGVVPNKKEIEKFYMTNISYGLPMDKSAVDRCVQLIGNEIIEE